MKLATLKIAYLALVVLAAGAAGGCDAVVDPGTHPVGVAFLREDQTEAAQFIYRTSISGTLTVPAGGVATYQVKVIAASGTLRDMNGSEYSIEDVKVVIPSLVTVSLQGVDDIVLQGLAPGNTTLRFFLKHGDHPEFEVRDVAVWVLQGE